MSGTTVPAQPAESLPGPLCIANVMLGRGLGGLEQVLLDYGDALALAGHTVHAVIHPDAAVRPELEARGAVWHKLSQRGAWDLFAAARLCRLLRALRPDACIAHGNRAVALLKRAGAWPLIGALPNYKMQCRGLAAVCCPTQDLRRYALAQGVPEARLYHIPNMVRVPPRSPPRPRQDPPVIGAMGRFVEKKGFDLWLAALARLVARGTPFRAVLGGDGAEAAALRRQAAASGLGDRISFLGWIADKPAFFAGIDLFCLPSRHEPFGIVLLEAMAQAVPVVATASEGPAEIVHDGVDAVLAPNGDPDALADALQVLLRDPVRAARLGEAGYRLVRDTYDLPRVAVRLDAALRHVVAAETGGALSPAVEAPNWSLHDAYHRSSAMTGAAIGRLAQLPARSVIELCGEDRVAFLQGLVSNDVAEAVPGRAVWAALLTPQGKYLADFFIFSDGDRLLLDCERDQVPLLLPRLTRFRLRSKVTLREAAELAVYAAWDGDGAPDSTMIATRDPRLPQAGWRLLATAPLAADTDAAAWDRHRLALGLPDGTRDLEPEKTVLLEAGFDELHGVSWSKGCYMGQELTARTKYRGLVKRRLVPVMVTGPLPAPGTPVLRDGIEVGSMRSGRDGAGLAVLRLEALGAVPLACGDARLTVRVPAWMRLPEPAAAG